MSHAPPHHPDVWPGCVAHCRTAGIYGAAIRNCLRFELPGRPKSWASHDGIFVRHEGALHVAEALGSGCCLTPWADYQSRIIRGKASVAVLIPTLPGGDWLTAVSRRAIEETAAGLVAGHPGYDWLGILGHALAILTSANIRWQCEWKWYCTELVAEILTRCDLPIYGDKRNPTPLTTTRRLLSGRFALVDEFTAPGQPSLADYLANLADAAPPQPERTDAHGRL